MDSELTVKDSLLGSSQVLYRWNNLYIKLIGSVAAPIFHNYTGLVAGTNVGCVWVDLKNWWIIWWKWLNQTLHPPFRPLPPELQTHFDQSGPLEHTPSACLSPEMKGLAQWYLHAWLLGLKHSLAEIVPKENNNSKSLTILSDNMLLRAACWM